MTAKQARDIATLSLKNQTLIRNILLSIRKKAEAGEFNLILHEELDISVVSDLNMLGYKVSLERTYKEIEW